MKRTKQNINQHLESKTDLKFKASLDYLARFHLKINKTIKFTVPSFLTVNKSLESSAYSVFIHIVLRLNYFPTT